MASIIFILGIYLLKKILLLFNIYNIFIILFLLIFFIIRYTILDIVWIQGESMKPTIKDSSFAIINKIFYGVEIPYFVFPFGKIGYKKICIEPICKLNELKKNDIVVFDFPDPILKKRKWIKRIVAVGGDFYEFKDSGLWINNELYLKNIDFLPEVHNTFIFELPQELNKYNEIKFYFLNGTGRKGIVPKDSYLVLGDNTAMSRDSRIFGFIPKERISGKLIHVF
ncbi:MAG: signal peptidase I [Leptonema sp. (in: bacteria)]